MPTPLRNVRSRGQSGKHLLALSFSGFDPTRTSALIQPRGNLDAYQRHRTAMSELATSVILF
jgi:hypothetical protein